MINEGESHSLCSKASPGFINLEEARGLPSIYLLLKCEDVTSIAVAKHPFNFSVSSGFVSKGLLTEYLLRGLALFFDNVAAEPSRLGEVKIPYLLSARRLLRALRVISS